MRTPSQCHVWPAAALLLCFCLAGCDNVKSEHLKVSGRVEVDDIHIGSKIGGRVAKVNYDEGDAVKAGNAIVLLEDQELSAQLHQAEAATSQAQAQLALLLAGTRKEDIVRAEAVVSARRADLELRRKGFRDEEIREAEAELASRTSAYSLSKLELDRSTQLLKSRAIDQSEFDRRKSEYEMAQALLEVSRQREALVKSGSRPEEIASADAQLKQAEADLDRLRNGARPEEIAAQRAAVLSADSNADRLRAQLDETRICAPSDAVVESMELEPGDLVKAGEPVAVLNLPRAPWVRFYVPENRLASVKVGQQVAVSIDSLPGKILNAKIRHVSAEAEFTPRNVQTTEKRAELVFEVKADIAESAENVRAGMYADVQVGSPPGN